MKSSSIGAGVAALVLLSALLWWSRSSAVAQMSVDAQGCTCSRPAALAAPGRAEAAVFYCVCPGMQCVITATAPTATQPANVAQSCR